MNRSEAHEFLDAVKAGLLAPSYEITAALKATGDFCSHRVFVGEVESLPFLSFPVIHEEEADEWPTVQSHRHAGEWERSSGAGLLRAAGPFDGLMA